MKKLLVSVFALTLLAGCGGSSEPKTVVCTGLVDGADTEITLDAKGDEVTKQTEVQKMKLTDMGVSEEDVTDEKLAELKKVVFEDVEGVEGIQTNLEVVDGTMVLNSVIDFTVADMDKLEELDLVESGVLDSISLEKTLEGYKKQGMTCNE